MQKSEAINLLGGTPTAAANSIGITVSAITQWPDVLPQRLIDRVQAALWRIEQLRARKQNKLPRVA